MNQKHTLWTLFRSCFLISSCTFGGGMVIVSMLQKKFVEELGWIKQDEVMDMVAISQSCPGVIAVNTSIMIGYRIAGIPGALLTVLGTVLPPMVILTVISFFYVQFRSSFVIALILKGMQAGVAAVMLSATATMTKEAVRDGGRLNWYLLIGASVAAVIFQVSIIWVLVSCGIIGGVATWLQAKAQSSHAKEGQHQ